MSRKLRMGGGTLSPSTMMCHLRRTCATRDVSVQRQSAAGTQSATHLVALRGTPGADVAGRLPARFHGLQVHGALCQLLGRHQRLLGLQRQKRQSLTLGRSGAPAASHRDAVQDLLLFTRALHVLVLLRSLAFQLGGADQQARLGILRERALRRWLARRHGRGTRTGGASRASAASRASGAPSAVLLKPRRR